MVILGQCQMSDKIKGHSFLIKIHRCGADCQPSAIPLNVSLLNVFKSSICHY